MGKTFTYTRQVGPSYYSAQTDEEFCDEEDFEYEVGYEEIREALSEIISEELFKNTTLTKEQKQTIKNNFEKFLFNTDMEDDLADQYEDDLRSYFEEKAFDSLDD